MPILEVRADEELVEMRTVLSIKERPGVEGILKKSFFSRLRMHDLHDLNYCLCWVLDKKTGYNRYWIRKKVKPDIDRT